MKVKESCSDAGEVASLKLAVVDCHKCHGLHFDRERGDRDDVLIFFGWVLDLVLCAARDPEVAHQVLCGTRSSLATPTSTLLEDEKVAFG